MAQQVRRVGGGVWGVGWLQRPRPSAEAAEDWLQVEHAGRGIAVAARRGVSSSIGAEGNRTCSLGGADKAQNQLCCRQRSAIMRPFPLCALATVTSVNLAVCPTSQPTT